MFRIFCAAVTALSSIIIATHVQAEQWGSYGSSTTALVDEYARSVHLSDRDSDGNITDADFIMWLADYTVGKIAVIDHNEDGDIDCADVQVELEKILVGFRLTIEPIPKPVSRRAI